MTNEQNKVYESSTIKSSVFNVDLNKLTVTFKNDISYDFYNVTIEDYDAFSTAESVGKSFNQYIKKYNGIKQTA